MDWAVCVPENLQALKAFPLKLVSCQVELKWGHIFRIMIEGTFLLLTHQSFEKIKLHSIPPI